MQQLLVGKCIESWGVEFVENTQACTNKGSLKLKTMMMMMTITVLFLSIPQWKI